MTADSKLLPLAPGDLEIRSFEGSEGSTYEFQQQSVRQHQQTYLGPYSAAFLFDQSGSITGTDSHDARISAARVFLANLSAGDEVGLLAFASGGQLPHEPVTVYRDSAGNAFTTDPNGFDGALANLADSEGGGTPLYESIVTAVNYTDHNANNTNRAVLVFTDGQNTDGGATLEDPIDSSIDRGITLHTIALSTGVDLGILSRLAGETGGSLTRATNAGGLISYYGGSAGRSSIPPFQDRLLSTNVARPSFARDSIFPPPAPRKVHSRFRSDMIDPVCRKCVQRNVPPNETVRNYVFVGRKMESIKEDALWQHEHQGLGRSATNCSTGFWPAGIRQRRSAAAS